MASIESNDLDCIDCYVALRFVKRDVFRIRIMAQSDIFALDGQMYT